MSSIDLDQVGILKVKGVEANPHCPALPVFNLDIFLDNSDTNNSNEDVANLCAALANCLRQSGALVVRDPRVNHGENERFLSLMERYFSQTTEAKMKDVHPELAYQVGATPEGTETPRCLRDTRILDQASKLPPEDRPTSPQTADVKWRFFWRVGPRPTHTKFEELNAKPVVPAAFPEWETVMNSWGSKMLGAVHTVAEMLALGFGLEKDAFTQRMRLGAHLLAPTGADLDKYAKVGTVFAGYHYDLNFLTIHGKSHFPGLCIWLKSGHKIPVRIPDGCLLLQAGKQLEWLTAGDVQAGFHEVVCTKETIEAAERARKEGKPAWRVSSTVFSQVASDEILRPILPLATPEALAAYPPIPSGKYVEQELEAINLRAPSPPCLKS